MDEVEWAIIISDQWQGHGLGTKLLRLLVEIGRKEKLSRLIAHILPDNTEIETAAEETARGVKAELCTSSVSAV